MASSFCLKAFCAGILFFSLPCFAEKEPIASYEVFFSDQIPLAKRFISLIKQEQQSIKLAAYCLRHSGVVKALIEAQKRGVSVEVIVDPYSIRARSAIKKIAEKKIPLYVWRQDDANKIPIQINKKKRLMHDSFCIFSEKKVWTGSVNFPLENSEENRENVVVLDQQAVANQFLQEFENLKVQSITYQEFVSKK